MNQNKAKNYLEAGNGCMKYILLQMVQYYYMLWYNHLQCQLNMCDARIQDLWNIKEGTLFGIGNNWALIYCQEEFHQGSTIMQRSQIHLLMNHMATCLILIPQHNFNTRTRINASGLQSYLHVCVHVCKYQTFCYEKRCN